MVTSRREGIPAALAMKHTGHEDVKVFHGYQRNAVGDDMHAVAARVHEARKRAAGRNGAPANGAQAADAGEDGVHGEAACGQQVTVSLATGGQWVGDASEVELVDDGSEHARVSSDELGDDSPDAGRAIAASSDAAREMP